ncbi:MAG: 8-oxo-dGTP diphosphatase [Firmicutes bacterium]|nr:8-oxo-dGTP diphosphatase [Bacillota bacterium]
MKETTLCYLEKDNKYLMLHRTRKKNDFNEGKWIGVGGKFEEGETADQCVCREVLEETGIRMNSLRKRAVIDFISDTFPDEIMHLYTCDDFEKVCEPVDDEGDLQWIDKERILDLPLWEGDVIFLKMLLEDRDFFRLRLQYHEYDLIDWELK